MELLESAKRVQRGVRLLDKKVPNWRQILRKHADQFDFKNGDCCVLGTLEHHSGRMRVLAKQKGVNQNRSFDRALDALGVEPEDYGFDGQYTLDRDAEMATLAALWRAEFEK